MVRWILGTAGTGKTSRVLEEAGAAARAGQKVLLLVPEQYSLEMEKAVRRVLDTSSAFLVEVYSFTRLCDRIFRELGGAARQAPEEAAHYLVMHLALEQLKGVLHRYQKSSRSGAAIAALTRQMEEFRTVGIAPQMLREAQKRIPQDSFAEKMDELFSIYETYDNLLASSFGEQKDQLAYALERLKGNAIFREYAVFVDSFKGFMAGEFDLLEELMKTASSVTFSLCTDNLFDQSEGYGLFVPSCRTAARLMELARKNGIPVQTPVILKEPLRFHASALAKLEQNLFREEQSAQEESGGIRLTPCRDPYEEIEWVAAEISHLVREERCRYRDIVVIGRDLEPYLQPVHASFADYEIPYFMDERFDVAAQPLTVAVLSAMEAAKSRFHSEDLFCLLKTGLLDFSLEQVAALEEYAYVWDISGARWEEPFVWNPSGFGKMREADEVRLREIEALRQRLMKPLLTLRKKIRVCSGRELVEALYEYWKEARILEQLKKQDAQEDAAGRDSVRALFDGMMDLWDQYAMVLGEQAYDLDKHCELMRLTLLTADLGQIPQGLDTVMIGTADRIRPNAPQYVFIIGANEDVFPAPVSRDGILSEREREQLFAAGLEVSEPFELRVLEERYFAYTAMTCASDGIFLSWSEESLDGSPLAPSVMVREVLAVFPQAVCRKASAEEAGFYALNEKTALHVFGSAVDRSSSKAQALGVFLEESAYTEPYQRIRHPVQPELFAMKSSETARTLFGGEMRLSPSKLDRYHQCRFAYFCERGLGIKKPRKAQLSPMESGTVIHYVLQKVISKYPGKELCSLSEEQCRKLVRQSLDDYLQDAMGGELDKTARFRYLFTRMANTLVRLIHHLAMEFAVCDFEPVAFELAIAKDSSVTPLELEMPDGGKIWVEGIVDRVDVMEKRGRRYVRVVDYKTGTKTFDFTDIYYGINLQMLVYLFSICQNGKGQLENTVPAGILYMPGKTGFLPADRHAEEEQMQAQQKRALKMNGLLLSDPVVLEGMESDGAGVFIPAKLKDGQIDAKSSVATLEELGKLKRHIESLLRQMAQTLWKGDIPALPLEEKQFDLCAWCDYRGICGREEDGPKRQRDEFSREVFFQKIGGEEDA